MNVQPRLKEHLFNLLNALTNLSPSRNLISQLILLLPKDTTAIERSYPEFSDPQGQEILKSLGIRFNEEIIREDGSFAEILYKHIHELFDWLDEETIRSEVAKVTDTPIDFIPNPYSEWARKVLAKFAEMPKGDKMLSFIKMLIEHNSFIVSRVGYSRGAYQPDWQPFLDDVKKKLRLNPAELKEFLELVVESKPEHISKEVREYSYTWSHETQTISKYLLHGEYYLDLIESEEIDTWWPGSGPPYRYDYIYYLRRHKATIKRLLEELKA